MATGTRPKPPLVPGLPPPSSPFEEAVAQILNGHNLAGATQRTVGQKDIAGMASQEYVRAWAADVVASVDLSVATTILHTFEDGYDYHAIADAVVPNTSNAQVYLRASIGGVEQSGATDYDRAGDAKFASGTNVDVSSTGDNAIDFTPSAAGQGVGSAAGDAGWWWIGIANPASASLYTGFRVKGVYGSASGSAVNNDLGGRLLKTGAISAISIYATGGTPNFSGGRLTLYRKRRAA